MKRLIFLFMYCLPLFAFATGTADTVQLKEGDPCPKFVFQNQEGEKVNLQQFVGKYVIIDVWASWCSPCKKEYPILRAFSEKYKDIVFVSISCDAQEFRWKREMGFMRAVGHQWWLGEDRAFMQAFAVASIPRLILLDKEGRIANLNLPVPSSIEFEKILQELTGQNKSEDDCLLQLLKEELQYNMQELGKQEQRPYYMNFRVRDNYNVSITSNFGAISASTESRVRLFVPQIRLGSPELDNFKYYNQGMPQQSNTGISLPLENDAKDGIREAIWQETLTRYRFAQEQWEATKSKTSVSVADEDKAPCFSEAPVVSYYEAPLPANDIHIDIATWQKRLNEISSVFKSLPELQHGSVSLTFDCNRNYFVNTEGTEVVQNRMAARIMLSASLKADDGMVLPLLKDYFAFNIADLPDNSVIIADAKDMIARLRALKSAPVADPFTGPAILSGPASGVFFHEIFGHRLEGHRLKTGGQTFKKMVGEQVLPVEFAVYCDPTLKRYANTDLNGYYIYDDEGVKARRVDNVVNGVLKEFLMSRVPLDGFPVSNGHGRAMGSGDPVSRQSNLIVETSHPYAESELREMLIADAKQQGKDYGYYIRTVTSGFTYTGEGGSLNSFNVTPLEVYRVYVDGRPDELVRGVDMIGTPLSMFSNIVAAGDEPAVFTGSCGAESGWVPVTTASPMIYVSQIETQRRAQSRDIPAILPAPEDKSMASTNEDDVIFTAMQDELERNLQQLALPGLEKPYYLAYNVGRYRWFSVMASLGGIINATDQPWQLAGSTQLMLGDYAHNSDIQYMGQALPATLPVETDYYNIRRGFWASSDAMYRYALNTQAQKQNILKANTLPADLAELPDMQQLPAVTNIEKREESYDFDLEAVERMAAHLSAIFKEYKDIYNSGVLINGTDMDIYHLTTEDVKLKSPQGLINLSVSAEIRTKDGSSLANSFSISAKTPADLPPLEELEKQVRAFAEGLLRLRNAPVLEEYYKGPVLFEGGAVAAAFERNFMVPGGLIAQRTLTPASGMLEDLFGRKIIDSRLTVKNRTATTEYNGVPLWGHYSLDADGVKPAEEMTLVEKGVLKSLLNNRYPTLKAPESTGSARFMINPGNLISIPMFGTMHVSVEKGTTPEKMKKALLKAAKVAGLDYAYIVRSIAGPASEIYRVEVKDGKETQVRVFQLPIPSLAQLSDLGAISSGEQVKNMLQNNCPVSVICPAGMIVNEVELLRPTLKTEKAPAIPAPQQR